MSRTYRAVPPTEWGTPNAQRKAGRDGSNRGAYDAHLRAYVRAARRGFYPRSFKLSK